VQVLPRNEVLIDNYNMRVSSLRDNLASVNASVASALSEVLPPTGY
jgi:hypothetical protein